MALLKSVSRGLQGAGFGGIRSLGAVAAVKRNFWSHVEMGPQDPILGVTVAFQGCSAPEKINVGVGAYRDNENKPFILPSVAEAQKRIVESGANMEYLPTTGLPAFVNASKKLAYGEAGGVLEQNKVAACQSISGTGALGLSANYFAKWAAGGNKPKVLMSNPTWGNHPAIFGNFGLDVGYYRYWDPETLGLDLDGMIEDLRAEKGPAVVLLHACAHNPTGVDPTMEQWQKLSEVCHETGHFVLFDNAYQGFATGDLEKDSAAFRYFIEDGHKVALCQSFAKNFGLYGQRVGMFSVVCEDADEASRVESQLRICARSIYSSPPLHGARIVQTILDDADLTQMWHDEIKLMSGRIIDMRDQLKAEIIAAGSTKNWDHITNQIGMFSYTGMSVEQCEYLTDNYHVYLTSNGRISMAGVTSENVKHLAAGIHAATQ